MVKIVWRFNLKDGVNEGEFFAWLKEHVWSSSAAFGCETRAFRLARSHHRYSTEATWPSDEARQAWSASDSFKAIPAYPGCDSPWGAQVDLEIAVYHPLESGDAV